MEEITGALPSVIAANIAAHNKPDPDAFIATFAADALVNDAKREFVGREAIRAFADKELFGDNVRMEVKKAYRNHREVIVHAKIIGDFDKANLPDPVILSYYFSTEGDKITQLIITLNKTIWEPH